MPAQLRVLRRRIRSIQSTKRITRAMELIATSRIARAQARVDAARPYSEELTRVLSAAATASALDHPLLVEREQPRRAGVLVVTSDRGLCDGYNANVIRAAEELQQLLREQGKEPVLFVIGRKGVAYYRFRRREVASSWTGFSEQPAYGDARVAARSLVASFMAGGDDTASVDSEDSADGGTDAGTDAGADGMLGVDELHIVFTQFHSMLSQTPLARRMAPLEVEYSEEEERTGQPPEYEFEPDAEVLFDALLPRYVSTRVYAALLDSAASESAARRRAMKAATDNANELIREYTREANQARQSQITQEISEIVGGADALAAVGSDD